MRLGLAARHLALAFGAFFSMGNSPIGCGGGASYPSQDDPMDQPSPLDGVLRVNHLQMKGTHNSFHLMPQGMGGLPEWNYSHAPLPEQLKTQGVRQFELDVFYDSIEGRFRVMHVPIVDEESTCRYFDECLGQLRTWSDGHRQHHPLFVFVEIKDALRQDEAETYFQLLEGAILNTWPKERILTPDRLRGSYPDVPSALKARGWPTLGEVRGQAIFVLVDRLSLKRRTYYTRGDRSLTGRLMFPDSQPGRIDAAVVMVENPISSAQEIQAALSENLLVWTLADEDSIEAKTNDLSRAKAAMASGAHMIATDYPAKVPQFTYFLELPGGTPSRCNPLTAPPECESPALK